MRKTYLTYDRSRQKALQKRWQIANKDHVHNKSLIRNFGITLEQYREMFDKQKGICAICGNPESIVDKRSRKIRNLSVDHDHKTGTVRGLLCQMCNSAIGKLNDDPELLMKAIRYLDRK